MSPAHSDIVVIGGGMAGASVAAELADAGASVCVLEGESQPNYHSTGRSAAIYIQNFGNRVIRGITAASRAFFDAPPVGFVDHPLLTSRGVLTIASESQMAAFEATLAEADGMERVDPNEALALVPILRPERVAAAALERGAMDIDVNALHAGYLRRLKTGGGRVVCDAQVTALARRGNGWEIRTRQGTFGAGMVINAAGAWADAVAALAGVRPAGLEPRRRTALIIEAPAGIPVDSWPLVTDADDGFYFKPEAGKLLLSPADATPTVAGDVQPEDLDVAIAVDRFEQAVSFSVDRVTHRWAGLRTFAPDGSPVIGWDTEVDGFFWLAGQGGYGIQTAPMASRAAAALVLDAELPSQLIAAGVAETDLSVARIRTVNQT